MGTPRSAICTTTPSRAWEENVRAVVQNFVDYCDKLYEHKAIHSIALRRKNRR
jgi:hypothetical protein